VWRNLARINRHLNAVGPQFARKFIRFLAPQASGEADNAVLMKYFEGPAA